MIDLHAHILPGIDDGPDDLVGSIAMAEVAVERGIETMAATPHVREDHPRVDPAEVAARVDRLAGELRARDVPLTVVPGGEVALSRAVDLDDASLCAVTLAGNRRDLLVETPYGPLPSIFEEVIGGLRDRGFRVLLAHPEVNADLHANLDRLGDLVDEGVLVQVTAAALAAARGRRAGVAQEALRRGWVHAIASDAHSAGWRPPDLRPARQAAGEELFAWLTRDAPAAILAGAELPPRPQARPPRRRRRRRLAWWR